MKDAALMMIAKEHGIYGEEKNDDIFAKQLADFADVYIDDAFGVSHRSHASVYGITKYFSNDSCFL